MFFLAKTVINTTAREILKGENDRWKQLNASRGPSLKSQMVTSIKLFLIAGAVGLTLWLIDYAVTR
jgi:hypothetical protein